MNTSELIADLDYASAIAKDGAQTPLVGGPIGLMWGVLLTAVFFTQWLVLADRVSWPDQSLGFLWLAFGVIGGLGSTILGRRIGSLPGANSVANRVENYVWMMFAALMATLFIGVLLNMTFQKTTPTTFDILVIVGFAGQGLAYGVVGKLTKLTWLHLASFAGFSASALCFSFYGKADIYIIAAIATLFTVIAPSLWSMKKVR